MRPFLMRPFLMRPSYASFLCVLWQCRDSIDVYTVYNLFIYIYIMHMIYVYIYIYILWTCGLCERLHLIKRQFAILISVCTFEYLFSLAVDFLFILLFRFPCGDVLCCVHVCALPVHARVM